MYAGSVSFSRTAASGDRVAETTARGSLPAHGFALIEVLVSVVLLTVGMLGLAALQARTSLVEMESYQRTQALILAQDMADRIVANKANARRYVGVDFGVGDATRCADGTGFQFDLCVWSNAIRGTTEKSGGINVGTLLGGRGCITGGPGNQYQIIVVWQGLARTVAPGVDCGRDGYGADAYRRAAVLPVYLPALGGA